MEMKWKSQVIGMPAYQPGKSTEEVKRLFGLESIVKMASNENPFGYSKYVNQILEKPQRSYTIYPDGYATELRKATASVLGVSEEQLIFTNGTDELIQIISRALLEPGKNTVMATPTFSQYRHNAILDGAEVREVPLVNGEHDLMGMLDQVDEQTTVVWVCNPNNPTGTYTPEQKLRSFLDRLSKDVMVVLDEAYFEYVVAEDFYGSIDLIKDYENVIITRTFSKIYGLASFRVGYGIAAPAVINALEPARPPFNTNVLGQIAAAAAIKDQAFVEECRNKTREALEKFYAFCEENGLKYYPSQTNFILIDFERDGDEVFQYLLEKGFIVRSGKALGAPTSVRITVGTEQQNDDLIAVMKEYLENQ
jgi:histidinol-phosphate aminotransferase